MVAVAATTIYRVTTVKRGAVTFVAVDGGMGDNLEQDSPGLKHDILCNTTGPVVDGGQRRVED
jgi:diaminopimelate decarboxylase